MREEGPQRDTLAELAETLAGPATLGRTLEDEARDELRRGGRISYMRARERRLMREQAVAAAHELG